MTFALRAARPDDAATLAELNRVVQGLHRAERPDRFRATPLHEARDWFAQRIGEPAVRAWLGEHESTPVGYVLSIVRTLPENPFCPARRWCEIDQLAVHPTHRRKGLGRALLAIAIEHAAGEGLGDIEVTCWAFNEAVQQLFAGIGFRKKTIRFELAR